MMEVGKEVEEGKEMVEVRKEMVVVGMEMVEGVRTCSMEEVGMKREEGVIRNCMVVEMVKVVVVTRNSKMDVLCVSGEEVICTCRLEVVVICSSNALVVVGTCSSSVDAQGALVVEEICNSSTLVVVEGTCSNNVDFGGLLVEEEICRSIFWLAVVVTCNNNVDDPRVSVEEEVTCTSKAAACGSKMEVVVRHKHRAS